MSTTAGSGFIFKGRKEQEQEQEQESREEIEGFRCANTNKAGSVSKRRRKLSNNNNWKTKHSCFANLVNQ
jgi:hypothetical protein